METGVAKHLPGTEPRVRPRRQSGDSLTIIDAMDRPNFLILLCAWLFAVGPAAAQVSSSGDDDLFDLRKNFEVFGSLYEEIVINYVDRVRPQPLMRAGIDAMMERLDPYTRFYDQADHVDMTLLGRGQLADVGLNIGIRQGSMTVLAPEDRTSAYRQGVRTGDVLVSVDGADVSEMTVRDVVGLLQGEAGTTVEITVRRAGRQVPLSFVLRRARPSTQNVSYSGYLNEDTTAAVGYVRLDQFGRRSAREVRRAFQFMQREGGLNGLVLDLRNNPGGILSEAIGLVGLFVPNGSLVVTTRGRQEGFTRQYRTENEPAFPDLPVAVLINEYSASASEIVAGSLQDLDRAVIIGETSFGKGLVQVVRSLPYNTTMKITVAHYYTPSGRDIQARRIASQAAEISSPEVQLYRTAGGREVRSGIGIEPDVEIRREKVSELEAELDRRGSFFLFANEYVVRPGFDPDAMPRLDGESLSRSFSDWLDIEQFSFSSSAETLIDSLSAKLLSSGYDEVETLLREIRTGLETEKKKDYDRYEDRIVRRLKTEIAARYLSASDQIRLSLHNDMAVTDAASLVSDRSAYDRILHPR